MSNLLVNVLVVLFSLIFGSLFYFIPYFKHHKEYKFKEYYLKNKFKIVIAVIMTLIALSRLFLLDLAPLGTNQDEVASGYDAFAIMMTGKDRNGYQFPAHLVSWGSGENVLYSYLIIPFLLIIGNSTLALRLPMGIISLLSIALVFDLFRRKYGYKIALYSAIFIAITPWHFMKSRWGLESNLFPELVFIGIYFLMCYIMDHKIYKFIISSIILGLSSYSYGTSYFFLFFFVVALMIYLSIKKLVKWYFACLYTGIIGIIAIPIILFLYVNIFEKESFRFLFIDIPRLTVTRFDVIYSIKEGNFFKDCLKHFQEALKVFFTQRDDDYHNYVEGFGTISYIALPFVFIGIFHKGDNHFINTLRIWLIITLFMLLIVGVNINRMNIIFYPLMLFSFYGTMDVIKLSKNIGLITKITYLVNFVLFSCFYFSSWNHEIRYYFFYSFEDAIKCSSKYEANTVYVTPYINQPYIYVLYYTKYDVNDFIETVNYTNPDDAFRNVYSFGNYVFDLPETLEEGNVYIVETDYNPYKDYDLSKYEVTEFELYTTISTIVH